MAGRVIEFVNDIDNKQREVVDKAKPEADRVGQIVGKFKLVKTGIDTAFTEIRSSSSSRRPRPSPESRSFRKLEKAW